jgi:cell shape-determining protein MreC
MLLTSIILGIVMMIGGLCIYYKTSFEEVGTTLSVIGGAIAIISFIVIIFCGISLSSRMTINDRIVLYETENKNIENQISSTIEGYKKYEQDTLKSFKNDSPITLVTLYPELKTNELIKNQINLYISNNQKIKELKEEKLGYKPLAWWVYFGN